MIPNVPMYALGAALVASLAWGGWQWQGKQAALTEAAEAKLEYQTTLRDIAEKTAEAARLAGIAKDTYYDRKTLDKAREAREIDNAFERGRRHGANIASGTVSVRTVWRDRECPKAVSGQGAESVGGDSGVDPGRAAAIGEILGLAGTFDATYTLAYRRLEAAQGLLNACYETPATGETP